MTSRDPMTSHSWRLDYLLYANFGAPYLDFWKAHGRHTFTHCRPQCPVQISPSTRPLSVQVWPLGSAKNVFTPYISVTLGNFPEFFSLSDTFPQTLPIPLCFPTNYTSGLGVGPPKKFLDPNYTKSGSRISLIFGSLIRPRVPLRFPNLGKIWQRDFPLGGTKGFSLTPNIWLTLGSFAKKYFHWLISLH